MAVRQMDRSACFGERCPELETFVIGNERARQHDRVISSLTLHHHASARTHDAVRRDVQDPKAGRRDFWRVCFRVHLGKEHELPPIVRIDLHAVRVQHASEAGAQLILGVAGKVAPGHFNRGAVRRDRRRRAA